MRLLTTLLDRLLFRRRLAPLPHAERLALTGAVSDGCGPIDRPANRF
jgi:hypothetical protein